MQGKIIKGIAGFYYVHVAGSVFMSVRQKEFSEKTGSNPLWGTMWRWKSPMKKIWKGISCVSFRGRMSWCAGRGEYRPGAGRVRGDKAETAF